MLALGDASAAAVSRADLGLGDGALAAAASTSSDACAVGAALGLSDGAAGAASSTPLEVLDLE